MVIKWDEGLEEHSLSPASDRFFQEPSLSKESHTGFINEAPSGGCTKGMRNTSFEKAKTTQIPRDGFSLLLGRILERKLYHMKGTGFHSPEPISHWLRTTSGNINA